ncbi:hypothetical protein S83_030110 [Arachis hypogaea]
MPSIYVAMKSCCCCMIGSKVSSFKRSFNLQVQVQTIHMLKHEVVQFFDLVFLFLFSFSFSKTNKAAYHSCTKLIILFAFVIVIYREVVGRAAFKTVFPLFLLPSHICFF